MKRTTYREASPVYRPDTAPIPTLADRLRVAYDRQAWYEARDRWIIVILVAIIILLAVIAAVVLASASDFANRKIVPSPSFTAQQLVTK
jgi:hypothetical protein